MIVRALQRMGPQLVRIRRPVVEGYPGRRKLEGCGRSGALFRPGILLQSACQQQDQQNDQNNPAEAPPDSRAAEVKTTAAEQQQKDDQQNY
jgi:hypothetical protein